MYIFLSLHLLLSNFYDLLTKIPWYSEPYSPVLMPECINNNSGPSLSSQSNTAKTFFTPPLPQSPLFKSPVVGVAPLSVCTFSAYLSFSFFLL